MPVTRWRVLSFVAEVVILCLFRYDFCKPGPEVHDLDFLIMVTR